MNLRVLVTVYFIHSKNFMFTWIVLSLLAGQNTFAITNRKGYILTPEILPTEKTFNVKKGEVALIICTVRNLGTRTVSWRRIPNENPLTVGSFTYVSDDRVSIQHVVHKDQWNLQIRNVSLADEGLYECQVSTVGRDIRREFFLDVHDWIPPQGNATIHITGREYVDKGETLAIRCNATGDYLYAPQTIDWFKNGNKITSSSSEHIQIVEKVSYQDKTITSDLTIRKATMKDAGIYLCRTSAKYITDIHIHVLNASKTNTQKRTVDQQKPSKVSQYNGCSGGHARSYLLILVILASFLT